MIFIELILDRRDYINIGYEDLQSKVIDWLRFPLVVMVVLVHCNGLPQGFHVDYVHDNPMNWVTVISLMRNSVSNVLAHVAVPTFFVFSGFLFFYKVGEWGRNVYFGKIKRRFWSLFVPYVCWNLIVIIFDLMGYYFFSLPMNTDCFSGFDGWMRMFWDCVEWNTGQENWLGFEISGAGPINFPLWYVRDLMVVSLLTPLIYVYLKYTRYYGVILLAILYLCGAWPHVYGLSVTAVFFFSMGAYFSIYRKNIVESVVAVRKYAYVAAIVLFFLTLWFNGKGCNLFFPMYVLSGVCAIINIGVYMVKKGWVLWPFLSQSTFLVYVLHTGFIMSCCMRLSYSLFSDNIVSFAVGYWLTSFLVVLVCVISFVLMKRFLPETTRFLMGNR